GDRLKEIRFPLSVVAHDDDPIGGKLEIRVRDIPKITQGEGVESDGFRGGERLHRKRRLTNRRIEGHLAARRATQTDKRRGRRGAEKGAEKERSFSFGVR